MSTIKITFLIALICITAPALLQAQNSSSSLDTLLVSEINIPLQINLKPIYALAEKKVDTAFTSPNWPNDWIQADCSTRYKYYFKRSPLRLTANGNLFNLSFTGYYKIIGSTRVCMGATTLSPWTPACRCGFDEGDRKVNIGFASSFVLQPNHLLNIRTLRTEPQPLNKCTVCFWGQDITTQVMAGLKAELDVAKKAIDDSFGVVNLKPYMQQAWNKLNDVYAIAGLGFFTLHPKAVHMENISAKNDLLHINIGISATPLISFERPDNPPTIVPNLSPSNNKNGFNIYLDALLNYDSLSHVVNQYIQNKRFDFSEGIFKKHVTINNCIISSDGKDHLLVQVQFSGSFNGTASFIGKPSYNAQEQTIEVEDLDYEVQT